MSITSGTCVDSFGNSYLASSFNGTYVVKRVGASIGCLWSKLSGPAKAAQVWLGCTTDAYGNPAWWLDITDNRGVYLDGTNLNYTNCPNSNGGFYTLTSARCPGVSVVVSIAPTSCP